MKGVRVRVCVCVYVRVHEGTGGVPRWRGSLFCVRFAVEKVIKEAKKDGCAQ